MRSKSEKQVRLLSSMLVSHSCLGKNSDLGNEPNCSALIEKIWLRSSSRGKIGLSGTGGDGAGASWEIPSHHHHSSLQMPFKRERIMDPLLLLNEFSNEWVVVHKVQLLHLELIFHSSFLFFRPPKSYSPEGAELPKLIKKRCSSTQSYIIKCVITRSHTSRKSRLIYWFSFVECGHAKPFLTFTGWCDKMTFDASPKMSGEHGYTYDVPNQIRTNLLGLDIIEKWRQQVHIPEQMWHSCFFRKLLCNWRQLRLWNKILKHVTDSAHL